VVGLVLFGLTVLVQLINLPVEFNASRRGRDLLQSTGLVTAAEDQTVAKVLNAAAWTYVAGTLSSLWKLLFVLIQFGFLSRRRSSD
jgi:Zn-dependent membrane protease YugP